MPTDLPAERIIIAPAVELEIGRDTAIRYRTEPHLQTGDCWECGQPAAAVTEPVTVVVRTEHVGPGQQQHVRLAHARCSPSDVRTVTAAEVADHSAPSVSPGLTEVSAVAMWWPPVAPGHGRPVLFVSFAHDLAQSVGTGDRVDIIASWLMSDGWQIADRLGRGLTAEPDDWAVAFFPESVRDLATTTGRLQLLGPHQDTQEPTAHADIEGFRPADLWAQTLAETGHVDVYLGPIGVDTWTEGVDFPTVQRAAKAGQLAGARLPALII